jgi:flagellar hook-associated protein 1 FlgK
MGTRGRQLDMNFAAQSSMLSQVQAEQQAVSGVNLDEEAVNLMRYQQAYEASAKVIAVADELFNVLLRMAG